MDDYLVGGVGLLGSAFANEVAKRGFNSRSNH